MKGSFYLGIALAFVAVTPCLAQTATSPTARFDELVRAETKGENVGMAIAVVFQGQVVYAKAFGVANLETGQPVTLDTVWTPTQLSEVFGATVVAGLAREGVLALDEPTSKYWPELNPQIGRITIRQLFQHRGGIKDNHVDFPLLDVGSLKKYALSCDAHCIIAEPGYIQSFSSRSGNLAAAVAEQASGSNFNDLLESRVFRPMGFTRTSLSILQVATQPIAQGHREGAAGLEVVRPLALNWVGWPTSSVFTSISEGISFIGALVNEGEWNGRQVFAKPLVAETLSLLQKREGAFTSRTGWAGIQAHYFFSPEKRFGLLMFKNSPTRNTLMPSISSGARAIWLGESQTPDSSAPALQPTPLTENQAAELVGVYRNEYVIRLEWREGSLMFYDEGTSYRKPADWIALKRLSDTQYMLVKPHLPYGTDLSVVRSTNGAVTHIVHSGRAFRKERSSTGPTGK